MRTTKSNASAKTVETKPFNEQCPFCANKARVVRVVDGEYRVYCSSCWASGPAAENDVDANRKWSTRRKKPVEERIVRYNWMSFNKAMTSMVREHGAMYGCYIEGPLGGRFDIFRFNIQTGKFEARVRGEWKDTGFPEIHRLSKWRRVSDGEASE